MLAKDAEYCIQKLLTFMATQANEAKNAAEAKFETDLQDVKTLRITNRELSEACERRAATIDELRGRLELAEQRLDQVISSSWYIAQSSTTCARCITHV